MRHIKLIMKNHWLLFVIGKVILMKEHLFLEILEL